MCLLPGVNVDLAGVERLLTWLLAYTWGSSGNLVWLSDGSGSVGILTFLALFICFSILRWYIRRDDQDLVMSLELLFRIIRGDGCVGDLKREVIQRSLSV
jgi:hypothetical protein